MFKRIDHVEIVPRDFAKSMDFYTRVLGFQVKQRQKIEMPPLQEIVYITLGDTMVEMMSVKDPAPPSVAPWVAGYRMMAIEVEDMDKALAYLKGHGIAPSRGPVALGQSRRAEIKDPDGLSIELRQW